MLLKPLSRAVQDGDSIHATILATGCNQDGRTSALTVPNQQAQIELMRRVAEQAGIEPEQVGYVEAHGTGTPTGDPIEFKAIQTVFAARDEGMWRLSDRSSPTSGTSGGCRRGRCVESSSGCQVRKDPAQPAQ